MTAGVRVITPHREGCEGGWGLAERNDGDRFDVAYPCCHSLASCGAEAEIPEAAVVALLDDTSDAEIERLRDKEIPLLRLVVTQLHEAGQRMDMALHHPSMDGKAEHTARDRWLEARTFAHKALAGSSDSASEHSEGASDADL